MQMQLRYSEPPALCMLQMFCAILVEFITFAKALSAFERASMWQTAVQLFARMRVADVTPDSISEDPEVAPVTHCYTDK